MLVATRDDPSLAAPMRALLDGAEKPEGLVLNLHDRPGPYLVGRESKRVAGPGHVKETALGPEFLVSPSSFFQTNVGGGGDARPARGRGPARRDRPPGPRPLQRRRALRPAARPARALGRRRRGEPQGHARRRAQPPPERGGRGPAEARVLVGGAGAAPLEGRGLRRRRPRPAARGLPARGRARGVRAPAARPRGPRLLQPRVARPRAAPRGRRRAIASSASSPWTCSPTRPTPSRSPSWSVRATGGLGGKPPQNRTPESRRRISPLLAPSPSTEPVPPPRSPDPARSSHVHRLHVHELPDPERPAPARSRTPGSRRTAAGGRTSRRR